MLKMKKRSLLVVLAFALVLALSCGAWAATTAIVEANGDRVTSIDKVYPIDFDATSTSFGLWAHDIGSIEITANVQNTTSQIKPTVRWYAALAELSSDIKLTGSITASGDNSAAFRVSDDSTGTMSGPIQVLSGYNTRGLFVVPTSHATMSGNIEILSGARARGLAAQEDSSITATGNVTVYADDSAAVFATLNSYVKLIGNATLSGDLTGDPNSPINAAVQVSGGSQADVVGNVTATGNEVLGICTTGSFDNIINLSDGTLSVSGTDAWAISITSSDAGTGTINLSNVTASAENGNLLISDGSGDVNISNNSTLTGNVLHDGTFAGTLDMTVTDSTWSGTAEASGDVGHIDISLENSTWNVTGDSDTNGKVTGDADSKIDFNGTEENITVEIDSLAGDPDIDMKVGDKLVITNSDGSITDITTSDPDIIDVVIDPDTKEITIVSKGDGDASIEYTYTDEDGVEQTKTIGVTSGEGTVDVSITGTPSDGIIYPGEAVNLTYDFSPYTAIPEIDNSGLAGSGLTAAIVDGKVVLSGTATNPGTYYYVVTLQRADGSTFTQKVYVTVESGSRPTDDDTRSYGSSGCNAGFGVLALLGLAFVAKKK